MSAPIYFYFHSVRIPAKNFCALASALIAFGHHHDHKHKKPKDQPKPPAPITGQAEALEWLLRNPPLPYYDEYHESARDKMRKQVLKDGFIEYGDEQCFECSAMSDYCFGATEWVGILADFHDYEASPVLSIHCDGTMGDRDDDSYYEARMVSGKIILQQLHKQSDYEEWDAKEAKATAKDPRAFKQEPWRKRADAEHAKAAAKRIKTVAALKEFSWAISDTNGAMFYGLVNRDAGTDDAMPGAVLAAGALIEKVSKSQGKEVVEALVEKMLRKEHGFDDHAGNGMENNEYEITGPDESGLYTLTNERPGLRVAMRGAKQIVFTMSELREAFPELVPTTSDEEE